MSPITRNASSWTRIQLVPERLPGPEARSRPEPGTRPIAASLTGVHQRPAPAGPQPSPLPDGCRSSDSDPLSGVRTGRSRSDSVVAPNPGRGFVADLFVGKGSRSFRCPEARHSRVLAELIVAGGFPAGAGAISTPRRGDRPTGIVTTSRATPWFNATCGDLARSSTIARNPPATSCAPCRLADGPAGEFNLGGRGSWPQTVPALSPAQADQLSIGLSRRHASRTPDSFSRDYPPWHQQSSEPSMQSFQDSGQAPCLGDTGSFSAALPDRPSNTRPEQLGGGSFPAGATPRDLTFVFQELRRQGRLAGRAVSNSPTSATVADWSGGGHRDGAARLAGHRGRDPCVEVKASRRPSGVATSTGSIGTCGALAGDRFRQAGSRAVRPERPRPLRRRPVRAFRFTGGARLWSSSNPRISTVGKLYLAACAASSNRPQGLVTVP